MGYSYWGSKLLRLMRPIHFYRHYNDDTRASCGPKLQYMARTVLTICAWALLGYIPRYWPFVWGIHRSPVNSPHKGQWRGVLIFSLICSWINFWVNNREAGDFRRYRAHYDVTVMDWISILNKKVKYITRTHSKLRFIHVCIHNKTKYYKISAYLWNILYIQHTISNYLLYNSINWSLSDYKGIVFHYTHTFSL